MSELTHARLLELVRYDPETGEFVRLGTRRRPNASGKTGSPSGSGYVALRVDRKRYLAHRLAWFYVHGVWPSEIDHINLDKTDNRIANLRPANRALNNANSVPRAKSGFKGVVAIRRRWRAGITLDGAFHCLGFFGTPEEAHEAYKAAARKAFGEFSRTGHLT